MLLAVEEFTPDLLPHIHSVYSSDSFLLWGDEMVLSSEGVQHGDPLGPLLFCLTIHKLCNKLPYDFATFYMDDGTFGRNQEHVVKDLLVIEEEAGILGLELKCRKTELICSDTKLRGIVLSAFLGLLVENVNDSNFNCFKNFSNRQFDF